MLSPYLEKNNIREAAGKRMPTASFFQLQSHKCTTGAHGCLSLLYARSLFYHHFLCRSIAHADNIQAALGIGKVTATKRVCSFGTYIIVNYKRIHPRRRWVIISQSYNITKLTPRFCCSIGLDGRSRDVQSWVFWIGIRKGIRISVETFVAPFFISKFFSQAINIL